MLPTSVILVAMLATATAAIDPNATFVVVESFIVFRGIELPTGTAYLAYPPIGVPLVVDFFDGEPNDRIVENPCLLEGDDQPCDPYATCTLVTRGGAQCSCPDGFIKDASFRSFAPLELVPDGTICPDIDECTDETDNCMDRATCVNVPGTFECVCETGYTGDGVTTCTDIDECALGIDSCHPDASCRNNEGSYDCTCNFGFTGPGFFCIAFDECTSTVCDENAGCFLDSGATFCVCKPGYTGDGSNCSDINECEFELDNCHDDATCSNTIGSYECACNSGYEGDGINCEDIDECEALSACHSDAICFNTPGYYSCDCASGFTGDGTTCTDIDECETPYFCPENEVCRNSPGSHDCECIEGYVREEGVCVQVFEPCLYCHEDGHCYTFSNGTSICVCNSGFVGDGDVCTDIAKIGGQPFLLRVFWLAITQEVRRKSYRIANPDFELPNFLDWL